MKTYRDLNEARAVLDRDGGWLLDIGDGVYFVTQDETAVREMRGDMGEEYMQRLEEADWDETQISEP